MWSSYVVERTVRAASLNGIFYQAIRMHKKSKTNQSLFLAALYAAFIAVSPLNCSGASAQSLRNNQTDHEDNFASYMLNLVNNDRLQSGSAPVEEAPKLQHLAQIYAEYLLNTGNFAHVDRFGRTPQDRANLYGIRAGVSENLAWQSSNHDAPTKLVQRAESSMMAEPANEMNHRYNILNPRSRYIGIGVAKAGDKVLMVQEFSEEEP